MTVPLIEEAGSQAAALAFHTDQRIGRDRCDLEKDKQVKQVAGHNHAVDAHHQDHEQQQGRGMMLQRRQPVPAGQQCGDIDGEYDSAIEQAERLFRQDMGEISEERVAELRRALPYLVDRVMGEASLYDPDLAALAPVIDLAVAAF